MRKPATLLIYCGEGRRWTDSETRSLLDLCEAKDFNILLLDTYHNRTMWAYHARSMVGKLINTSQTSGVPMPGFYVSSFGVEHKDWIDYLLSIDTFLGLYWNGAGENPQHPPPETDHHGARWELWIPYTAGAILGESADSWGLDPLFDFLNDCHFPNRSICVQPNVYQSETRDFWDFLEIFKRARKYRMSLELEFDERMLQTFLYYKWFHWSSPKIFSCVYGGDKHVLRIKEILRREPGQVE